MPLAETLVRRMAAFTGAASGRRRLLVGLVFSGDSVVEGPFAAEDLREGVAFARSAKTSPDARVGPGILARLAFFVITESVECDSVDFVVSIGATAECDAETTVVAGSEPCDGTGCVAIGWVSESDGGFGATCALMISGWGARGLGLALRARGIGFVGLPEGGAGVNMAATAPAEPFIGSADVGRVCCSATFTSTDESRLLSSASETVITGFEPDMPTFQQ